MPPYLLKLKNKLENQSPTSRRGEETSITLINFKLSIATITNYQLISTSDSSKGPGWTDFD